MHGTCFPYGQPPHGVALFQATAFLFASPPVTVLAGPWLFFAVLSSFYSCIWFYDQIFICLHSVLPLFS